MGLKKIEWWEGVAERVLRGRIARKEEIGKTLLQGSL